jgi:lipoic acid synthetase
MILYEWKVGAKVYYIDTTLFHKTSCGFYFGLEEYLLNDFEIKEDIFLLWRVDPTVMIGKHQILQNEVDLNYTKKAHIDIVRRNSGGGAVFTDDGCFQFSFITAKEAHSNIFKNHVTFILQALKNIGVDAEFVGRNDILLQGKKISGIAEYIHGNRMVIHGTILYDSNMDNLINSLIPKQLKLSHNGVQSVKSRVTNLSEYISMPIADFEKHLIKSIGTKKIDVNKIDLEKVKLYERKFYTKEWNIGKNPPYEFENTSKFESGIYTVYVKTRNNLIKSLKITGDFFALGDISEFEKQFVGLEFSRETFVKITKEYHIRDYFIGLKRTEFLEMFFGKRSPKKITKPKHLRINLKDMNQEYKKISTLLHQNHLHTVCEEASCPNQLECFSHKTATFMILGSRCTRNCSFCDVAFGRPDIVDPNEPQNIVKAVKIMGLKHVVVTSVTRDDLKNDYGSTQFEKVIKALKDGTENTTIEVLIPDFQGYKPAIEKVVNAGPDVINHNLETIKRLSKGFRDRATYEQSLEVLRYVKEISPNTLTKSGIMVGIGETEEEVIELMKDLRNVHCDILTIGQYLQPSKKHAEVKEYVSIEQFERYESIGKKLGFRFIASGPMVRSSYQAYKQFEGESL